MSETLTPNLVAYLRAEISKREYEVTDLQARLDYEIKRREAAERVLGCVPVPACKYYLYGFKQYLSDWQQLKNKQHGTDNV